MRVKILARLALTLGCVATGLTGASCEKDRGPLMHQYLSDQITDLGNANVPKEVDAAVNKGDYQFVAINDHGTMVPGVDDSDIKIVRARYGLRMIENTTDAPRDKQHEELQTLAWGYAHEYNSLLKRKIPAGR